MEYHSLSRTEWKTRRMPSSLSPGAPLAIFRVHPYLQTRSSWEENNIETNCSAAGVLFCCCFQMKLVSDEQVAPRQ